VIDKPNAISRAEKRIPFGSHLRGVHDEDQGFSVSLPNLVRCRGIGGKVNVVPCHLTNAIPEDGVEVSLGRSVEEFIWGCQWLKLKFNFCRVSLVSSNLGSCFIEGESLLLAVPHNLIEFVSCEVKPSTSGTCKQIGHRNPPAWFECESDFFWFVPKMLADELADVDSSFLVHGDWPSFQGRDYQTRLS
jgi:hypothetical protein